MSELDLPQGAAVVMRRLSLLVRCFSARFLFGFLPGLLLQLLQLMLIFAPSWGIYFGITGLYIVFVED